MVIKKLKGINERRDVVVRDNTLEELSYLGKEIVAKYEFENNLHNNFWNTYKEIKENYKEKLPNSKITIFESKNGHFNISEFPEIVEMIKKDLMNLQNI